MQSKWIKPLNEYVCPTFVKEFKADKINNATLKITAFGVYEAVLNGQRISNYVFAPGWTAKRLQYQEYDIKHLIKENAVNILEITVGKGWYRSPLAGWRDESKNDPRLKMPAGLCACLKLDNTVIETDTTWKVKKSPVVFSELYDGEHFDARIKNAPIEATEVYDGPKGYKLVPQQGDEINEIDRISPLLLIKTPKGETVIDFGQNITGYIEFTLPESTAEGQEVNISFAEVLDKDGNFYTANYRSAKSKLCYTTTSGAQSYKPKLTFFGFRYIRLDSFPCAPQINCFTAIVVHSNMKRCGWLSSSNQLLNNFFDNVVWGQKGNFLDVPTDCPQRDERLGWTGDAQAFIKTASYFYDVEKFFTKWLTDLALEQLDNGLVPYVIPDCQQGAGGSAAWADAATICPWQIYLTYGNPQILENQYSSMVKWLDHITKTTTNAPLWTGGVHFGDWLSLDLPPPTVPDVRRGLARHDLVATAFYAHSASLVIKAGKVLGKDVSAYENLYKSIVKAYKENFNEFITQTEYILTLHFNLTDTPQQVADALAEKIKADGNSLKTGFVGTPYILHVLSRYGYTQLAYTLLLNTKYPSWLYPVTKGATTVWERWDSIKPDGTFQTSDMNSFNHYAYGAVADWVFEVAAGISPIKPGYKRISIAPKPDKRLGWLEAKFNTRQGMVVSKWQYISQNKIRYDIETPTHAEILINGQLNVVDKGLYTFFGGH